MWKHYLKTGFRKCLRNKTTTFISILGLAVGISASIVIFLIVQYDYSFDKWEPHSAQIYRVATRMPPFGMSEGISELAPDAIIRGVPGIDASAYILQAYFDNPTVEVPGKGNGNGMIVFTKNDAVSFADADYFKIFPRLWLEGSPSNALSQINQVVLTASEAKKYFPHQALDQIIGRSLVFEDSVYTTVTGIIADLKAPSDFDNKIFISLKTYQSRFRGSNMTPAWRNVDGSSQFFVLLNPHTDPATVNRQLKEIFWEHEKDVKKEDQWIGQLQPLADVHFNTDLDGKVSKPSLRHLGLLAIFLLLLAVINFINLSTAQSTLRAKEIGVRKTFGSKKTQIACQFLTEAFLITVGSTVLAILLSPLLLYIFKGFVPEGLDAKQLFQPVIAVFLAGMIVLVTLLAGLYPAFVLTKFRPAKVLKSQPAGNGNSNSSWVRQALTVFQFTIAQVFLIVVFVIGKQVHFELNKDIGMKKNAIASFYIPDFRLRTKSKKYVLAEELKKIPEIKDVSISSAPPVRNGWSSTSVTWYDRGEKKTFQKVHTRSADDHYIGLFGLKLIAGKNIHVDTGARVTDVLINETLLHQMNLQRPEDAIGQFVKGGPSDSAQIVGVLKDFTTMSLHNPIYPTVVFANNKSYANVLSLAFRGNDASTWKNTLEKVEKIYKGIYPHRDFDYTFLDESIRDLYKSDIRLSALLKWATLLSIFISCLGLLGLITFVANQRTKEIGIRKVLGASVAQIISLLSKHLIRLVALASLIAFPVSWYFAHKWLEDFAFRAALSWWIFVLSGAGMLLIGLTVLCLRTFKAATASPVDSLRIE